MFGPKVSKNGYRYDIKVIVDVANNILALYTRVIGKSKVTNGHINKSFAQGVIYWLNGGKLNQTKHAIYCGKYVSKLRETKAANVA